MNTQHNRAGQALVESVTADLAERSLVLGPDEQAVLHLAADLADDCASLRQLVRRDGRLVTNPKTGAVKLHPAVNALATARAQYDRALMRLSLVMEGPAGNGPQAAKDPVKAKAGRRSGQVRRARRGTA
jgi:hypothetical protein